ncbi:hypothetical protein [Solirubrobacter deserti]|uniref:Lipoprotein LpqB beta-propeller domain-containing protein n=1 Tax=Solirubrobacter deserti TaxID=2282478 RepID=A0ABT4RIP3_9ACTN|nr:hypothetical protein [Solirubrobacter deserti]MDA0138434.1 hypothetical protein [Solirubrobacter deserti]
MRLIEPLLAAAVAAAPTWSHERLTSALDGRGASYDAIVAGLSGGLIGATFGDCASGFAPLAATAPPPVTELREELWAGPIATADHYTAVLNTQRCGGTRMDLAAVAADGRVLSRAPLPVRGYAQPVELAPGAVAWAEHLSDTRVRVRALVGGKAVTLASEPDAGDLDPGVDELTVTTAPDGRVLVAWSTQDHVRAAIVSRSGKPGLPVTVGRSLDMATPVAALGTGGRAVVAWSTRDGGEEQNERTRVYAAVRAGGRFRPAQLLDRARTLSAFADDPDGDARVALAPDGRALASWTALVRGERKAVRVAAARPGQRFGARRTLTADGTGADVAFTGDSRPLVTWAARGAVYLERNGRREKVAATDGPHAPRVSVLADGRVRVTWRTGFQPALHVATD